MTNFTRRDLLKYGSLAAGASILPVALYKGVAQAFSPAITPFALPFRIPPVLQPIASDATTDYYQITMQRRQMQILPGYQTECWTYNGSVPGPTIYQRKDRQSKIRFINQLTGVPTSVHLHGMASLPQYDGYANDLTMPGQYKDYSYPNNRAATLWYHDHAIHKTAFNTYMGLSGLYIVQDQTELDLPLPKGRYDVPMILQDKMFTASGALDYNNNGNKGSYGDIVLINGVPWPVMQVERRKYRFRILNGSTSRSYRLRLTRSGGGRNPQFTMIGTDAGLMGAPVQVTDFRIGMAERYEFVIDFAEFPIGTQITMRNASPKNNNEDFFPTPNTNLVMRFDVTAEATDTTNNTVPATLRPVYQFNQWEIEQARVREWRFERANGMWLINGRGWNTNRVEANPGLNDIERWRLINISGGWFHPVHIHLVDLQILSRNGQPPFAYERGWKDVFYVGEVETVEVVARFGPNRGKYMMHCHNVEHEDVDMMIQWEIGQGGPDPMSAPAQPWSSGIPLVP
jgi:spore coat protein A, manganese oxidase